MSRCESWVQLLPSAHVCTFSLTLTHLPMKVSGALEYDSFGQFSFSLSNVGDEAISLADVQLELPLVKEHARYMVGMGVEGIALQPIAWRWALGTGNNGLWIGRVEGGVFLKLRGEGSKWEDPSEFTTPPERNSVA